jgi:hypothetical protein
VIPDLGPEYLADLVPCVPTAPGRHGEPRLMLVYPDRLPIATFAKVKEKVDAAYQSGEPLILDGNPKVYQFIDGRWEPLP